MNPREKLAVALLSESLTDAEVIAKSMVGNAVDRSMDLKVNPVITLLVMKALCQLAIDEYTIKFNKKHGFRVNTPEFDFLDGIEDMIVSVIVDSYKRHKEERKAKL